MNNSDNLYRYLFDNYSVRGELVQLSTTIETITRQRNYPADVQTLLEELVIATSLLTATIKFEGEISVQLQGDGPVKFIAVNGNHNQQLRGVAQWDELHSCQGDLEQLLGEGQLVITISPTEGERYQGLVAINPKGVAASLEQYFAQSEQLPTRLWFFTGQHEGQKCAAGTLLQLLPSSNGEGEADLEHLSQLTDTLKSEEIFTLPAQDVLYRLYHQEEVRLFDPQPVEFSCSCSQQRCEAALFSIDHQELIDICDEQGDITMDCDYCGSRYEFDKEAINGLFHGHIGASSPKLH